MEKKMDSGGKERERTEGKQTACHPRTGRRISLAFTTLASLAPR